MGNVTEALPFGRTDLVLVAAGIAGLVSFVILVEQTSIAPAVAPSYGLRELPRLASEHARNAGTPLGIVERAYFHAWRDGATYTFVAAREGASAARAAAAIPGSRCWPALSSGTPARASR